MKKNNKVKLKILLLLIACSLLTYNSYAMEGLRWSTDSKVQEEYKKEAHDFWSHKNTKYLLKHFKDRATPKSDSFFFARPVKHRIDFKVILFILSNRLEDEGVLECFVETAKNPRTGSNTRYIIPAIALYYDKGIDVSSHFIDLYKNPEAYEFVKDYIVKVVNEKKIRILELVPYVKEELKRRKTSLSPRGAVYGKSTYETEIQYLKFMEN